MTRLVARFWVPFVMVVVTVIAAFTVARLHGVFGSDMYKPDNGNADAIIQFNPKHVLFEIFGAPGTVAAVLANVIAQGNSDSIGCRITVNGVVRDQESENLYHAQTSCLVKSA
jgi:NhaP-type Na+/H+ or K+/H+ antiporter